MPNTILPESAVLLPRDPSITDTDDWPEFILHDAIVSLPGTGRHETFSLLLAHENFPMRVSGRLTIPPPEDQAHLWQPSHRASGTSSGSRRRSPDHVDIELAEVRSFAYGSYPDGGVEIWAAGQAGWFVLRPSALYERVYKDMVEAVNVLYFIVDAYKSGVTKEFNAVNKFFRQYSREIDGDSNDAQAMIHKHRDFLLSSMLTNREGVDWKKVPLFQHLRQNFPKDVTHIQSRLAGPSPLLKTQTKTVKTTSHTPTPTTSGVLKRKRGDGANGAQTEVISLESTSIASYGSEKAASTASRNTRGKNAPKLGSRREPSSAPSLASRRTRGLRGAAPETSSETPEPADAQTTPPLDSDSDSGVLEAKTKSALRLKPNKPMKGLPRAASKGGKGTRRLPDDNDDEDGSPGDDPAQSMHLLPPHASTRRNESLPLSRAKRRGGNRGHDVDEGIDIPTSPSSTTSDPPQAPPPLPGEVSPAHPDPLQEATWTCALAGCAHKVYPSPDAQALIREHYALHAYDDDRRVRLVRTLQAPSLPVEHLLERVKMQARVDGFPASTVAGTRFPEGLRTRY